MTEAAPSQRPSVLVMSMWPSTATPEYGCFVQGQVEALRADG